MEQNGLKRQPRASRSAGTLRARLHALGADALSDADLLALIAGESAESALRAVGADSLERLRHLSFREGAERIGEPAAARVLAALELGLRAAGEPVRRGRILHGPGDVYGMFGPRLRHLAQEEFHVLLLDTRHRLLRASLVTRGTADTSLVHAREVFREAIREAAAAVILVHNHPSGDPRPSPEDLAVTRQLAEAGQVIGIPVLDHVIVGDGRFVSMAEEGGIRS